MTNWYRDLINNMPQDDGMFNYNGYNVELKPSAIKDRQDVVLNGTILGNIKHESNGKFSVSAKTGDDPKTGPDTFHAGYADDEQGAIEVCIDFVKTRAPHLLG